MTPQAAHADPWRELLDLACAPYAQAGRFAWHFARGKLGRDPVFRALLQDGLFGAAGTTSTTCTRSAPGRVLDIGCGQGLLASLLAACGELAQSGRWPARWGAAPVTLSYTGVELMSRDVERANNALGRDPSTSTWAPRFICGDMCQLALPACDTVVILDVLHYVDHARQAELLARVRHALQPGGRLLLRVGDVQQRWGFAVSQWVDRSVSFIRGHRVAPSWGRSVAQWAELLRSLGFRVDPMPMARGTPFANVLLVCEAVESMQ